MPATRDAAIEPQPGRLVIVSHSHLDREWYRTAEALRNRLVDAVDAVLGLLERDPEFVFVLDGQSIVLEDYLELRPGREAEIRTANAAGRLSFGPWYVQPDGFIPAAESIVRNLMEGRLVAERYGRPSAVGYLPDTFGHPAQLPLILAGFGLDGFCFRRGANDETAALSSEFIWEARDGSAVLALYLAQGYSNAGHLPGAVTEAAARLEAMGRELLAATDGDTVALMHGCDHAVPTDLSPTLFELRRVTDAEVVQGTMDDVLAAHRPRRDRLRSYHGELRGARGEALLPGVLSTRTYLKLANARCEAALLGLAEPFAALSRALGGPDDSVALRVARRRLLANHAHDSLCGTSVDEVHREMEVRFRSTAELAQATAERAFGTLGGTGAARPARWEDGAQLAVFNPHPYPFTGVVEHWFDADPPYAVSESEPRLTNPPLLREVLAAEGLAVDGHPARLLTRENTRLFLWHAEQQDRGVEFCVQDLPAFGWARVELMATSRCDDLVDDGRRIEAGGVAVELTADGTVTLAFGDRSWFGLLGLEDVGDRGDCYDFAGVGEPLRTATTETVCRHRHPGGIQRLRWSRRLRVPRSLDQDRALRSPELVDLMIDTEVRLAPGIPRVDISVRLRNTARDHRLRLTFPLATAADSSLALGPFDLIERPVEPPADAGWTQPAPRTFPAHGGVTIPGSGLAVCAPGLLETEVSEAGELAVTLLRAVGLIGADVPDRGVVAPAIQVPQAQCEGPLEATFALVPLADDLLLPRVAREVALPLGCAEAGPSPRWEPGRPLLAVGPFPLVLSAVKPSEAGSGMVVRVWNPGDAEVAGWLEPGWTVREVGSVRLDETPDLQVVTPAGGRWHFRVPPHGVRSVLVGQS